MVICAGLRAERRAFGGYAYLMSEVRPIIVKRKKVVVEAGHHGGAWKVAYADFVTAMMAFFLLMWLLNATTEEQRKGLADYFNPSIPIAAVSGGGRDALHGDNVLTEQDFPSNGEYWTPNPRKVVVPEEDALKAEIQKLADGSGLSNADGRVVVRKTPEGTVIELVDTKGEALFASGSSTPSDDLELLIASAAKVIIETGADIKITGHTDAAAFIGSAYSNWELSAERANTARRLLLKAGMPPERIQEVSGRADRDPVGNSPNDPANRRIAIVLRDPSAWEKQRTTLR